MLPIDLETDATIQTSLEGADRIEQILANVTDDSSQTFESLDTSVVEALQNVSILESNASWSILGAVSATETVTVQFNVVMEIEDDIGSLLDNSNTIEETVNENLDDVILQNEDITVVSVVTEVVANLPPPPPPAPPPLPPPQLPDSSPAPSPPPPPVGDADDTDNDVSSELAIVLAFISSILVLVIIAMIIFVHRVVIPRWRSYFDTDDCPQIHIATPPVTQLVAPSADPPPIAQRTRQSVPAARLHGSYAEYLRDRGMRV